MLPALQCLSVLPLWFSFGHSSSSFEEPTCLCLFIPRIRVWIFRQAPVAATGLHNLSFLRGNPVHLPTSGTSGLHLKEVLILGKDQSNLRNQAYQTRNLISTEEFLSRTMPSTIL
ncbi:hypothetical protein ATANTOWER_003092 [Ataeniobius toweri]|uniref:Secreted protein n=1 Tax=Ataeniobius toweri TaxID=208326 RepID=A0ABU7C776_9TELE|nr:hypothetical protein [Ataeniobius toweri]